jgi:hypothetical protein
MLPAAFVASVVKSEPRATRLYYLAAAYTSSAAADPVWSTPEEQWATSLPYLEIAHDLNATAIASTLGIALGRLSRSLGWDVDASAGPTSSFGEAFAGAQPTQPAQGEPRILWRHETTGTLGTPRIIRGLQAVAHAVSAEEPREPSPDLPPAEEIDSSEEARASAGIAYDDGHGPLESATYGLESTYPAGAAEPDELPDSDEGVYGDEASWQAEAGTPAGDVSVPRAFDRILDELARTKSGALYDVARPTENDGLAFGLLQATQRSGELGRVLERLRASDAGAFDRVFGTAASELLDVTTAESESARMRPVNGRPLTDEHWRRLFTEAGRSEGFVTAQRLYARQRMLEPLLPLARDLGLGSTKGLAVLACILVAKGLDAGMRWILAGISPVSTAAQLVVALPALGQPNLAALQRAEGLRPTGELDVPTQARLTRKLRELGARSSVPVLAPAQMIQTLVRHAAGEPFQAKLEGLVANPELDARDL